MAFSHGSLAQIAFDPLGGTSYTLNATVYLNEASPSQEIDTAETTVLGNTAKNYIPGLEDGTFSCSGLFDPTFATAIQTMKRVIVSFRYRPAGTGTGLPEWTGKCIMTSYNVGTSVDEAATVELEFQITNGITVAAQA